MKKTVLVYKKRQKQKGGGERTKQNAGRKQGEGEGCKRLKILINSCFSSFLSAFSLFEDVVFSTLNDGEKRAS